MVKTGTFTNALCASDSAGAGVDSCTATPAEDTHVDVAVYGNELSGYDVRVAYSAPLTEVCRGDCGPGSRPPLDRLRDRAILLTQILLLFRTAPRDYQPRTAIRQRPPTTNRHQPPTATNRHQPPTANRQPPTAANRQPLFNAVSVVLCRAHVLTMKQRASP